MKALRARAVGSFMPLPCAPEQVSAATNAIAEYDAAMNVHLRPDTEALPKSVRIVEGAGGLPRLDITTPAATAQAYLHGAHLTHWLPSHAKAPVLWISGHSLWQDSKPIRGGVPICFPWFGPHRSGSSAPAHGFARLLDWTLASAVERDGQSVALTFALQGARVSEAWPFRFRAEYEVAVGSTLTTSLEVENRDDVEFSFEEALHTYFGVSSIADVAIAGLERTRYVDKAGGLAERTQDDQPIRFSGETDRVYLDTTATCSIDDPGLQRRIIVSKHDSRSTVVWNPWIAKARAMADFGDDEWREMVCVETANVGAAAVRLVPGERHRMTVSLAVESC
jgi:D-hexose-6-phosphate mutarotase